MVRPLLQPSETPALRPIGAKDRDEGTVWELKIIKYGKGMGFYLNMQENTFVLAGVVI